MGRDTIQNDFGQMKDDIVEEDFFLQQMESNEDENNRKYTVQT